MELFAYVLFSSFTTYCVISILHQKFVGNVIALGTGNIYKGKMGVVIPLVLILLLAMSAMTILSSSNLAFNYNFLILSLIIGIPLGWVGIKICYSRPEWGPLMFAAILAAVGLVFKLLTFSSII